MKEWRNEGEDGGMEDRMEEWRRGWRNGGGRGPRSSNSLFGPFSQDRKSIPYLRTAQFVQGLRHPGTAPGAQGRRGG